MLMYNAEVFEYLMLLLIMITLMVTRVLLVSLRSLSQPSGAGGEDIGTINSFTEYNTSNIIGTQDK